MQSIKVAFQYSGNRSLVGNIVDAEEYDKAERGETLPGDSVVKLLVFSHRRLPDVFACLFVCLIEVAGAS